MEQLFTSQFFTQLGASGIVAFAAYRAVHKLYDDIRQDSLRRESESKKREDRLMDYLDKKNETDKQVADTLRNIDGRLNKLECRKGD